MIITDGFHLVSTISETELHEFAQRIGLIRKCYQDGPHQQHPHYDLTTKSAVTRAIKAGAQKVSREILFLSAWWSK